MSPVKRSFGLRRYIVAGVLVWLPILATLWVIHFIIALMDETLLLLPPALRPEAFLGFSLPGIGAVLAFVIVFVTGLLVTNLLGRRLVAYWEGVLQRIPFVRSIYGGVKGFTESVFSSNNSFRRVVTIEYPRLGLWSLGFVTAENLRELSAKTGQQQVCVFVPAALNPTSGFIVMSPRDKVVELNMSVDVAMKMIITCGVVVPPA